MCIRDRHTKARVEKVRRRLQAINQRDALQVAMNITKDGNFVRLAPSGDVHRFINLVKEHRRFPDWPTFTQWMAVHLGGKANSIATDAVAFVEALGHQRIPGNPRHCGCSLPPRICLALQTLGEDAQAMAETTYNGLVEQLRVQTDLPPGAPRQTWHDLFNRLG